MLNIIQKMVKNKKRSAVEDHLNFYRGVSNAILSLGLFGFIFNKKLDLEYYFGLGGPSLPNVVEQSFWQNALIFLEHKWVEFIFALFVLAWFFLYKIAVKSEMAILVNLYSRINPPHDWKAILGQKWIPLLSVGLTFAFLGLAWSIDNLKVFCVVMLFLNIQDVHGNNLLRRNLLKHFLDPALKPHPSDLHAPFIEERRQVALDYWVWRPQLERIGLMMIATILTFFVMSSESVFGVHLWDKLPYFMIMGIIIINEYTISVWRIDRDRKLEDIDLRQEAHERKMGATTA